MSEVKVIRLPEGDSALDRRKIEGTDKEEEFISLIVHGTHEPQELAKKLKMNLGTVERTLRDCSMIGKIKAAVQARAVTLMPKTLESAYQDSEDRRARIRANAREYIRKVAEGEPQMIQQNNQITSWDPEYDERLFQKGMSMFQSLAEVAAEATVTKMLDQDED
jgi:hypothetical protein